MVCRCRSHSQRCTSMISTTVCTTSDDDCRDRVHRIFQRGFSPSLVVQLVPILVPVLERQRVPVSLFAAPPVMFHCGSRMWSLGFRGDWTWWLRWRAGSYSRAGFSVMARMLFTASPIDFTFGVLLGQGCDGFAVTAHSTVRTGCGAGQRRVRCCFRGCS